MYVGFAVSGDAEAQSTEPPCTDPYWSGRGGAARRPLSRYCARVLIMPQTSIFCRKVASHLFLFLSAII
jgi:hypothetical protein